MHCAAHRPSHPRALAGAIAAICAFAAAGAAGALAAPPAHASAAVDRAVSVLRAPGSTPDAREAALAELRERAGGAPDTPETREAILELARYRAEADFDGRPHRRIADLIAATTLYPDDPRALELLPRLAQLQLGIDDPYGAHLAFRAYARRAVGFADGAQAALAAHTAARALDMRSAMEWSDAWLDADLAETDRVRLWLARLQAAFALARMDDALRAVRALELHAEEALRLDGDACWTAAETYAALGHEKDAIRWYSAMANVHPSHPEHPAALLALERLHRKAGRTATAAETRAWLLRAHPESREARTARLERIALDPEQPIGPGRVGDYVALAREASTTGDADWVGRICDELYARLTGAGYPLEAAMGILAVATDEPDGLAALVARRTAPEYLAPAVGLLASRGQTLEIAALGAAAREAGVALPDAALDEVNAARTALGLAPRYDARVEALLADVRRLREEGHHDQVLARMKGPMRKVPEDPASPPPWLAEATRLYADSLWRETEIAEADARIARSLAALEGPGRAEQRRELLALRGDILFGEDRARACEAYRGAAAMRPTPWVAAQVRRCDAARSLTVSAGDGDGAGDGEDGP